VKKTVRAKAGDRELIVLNENVTGSQLTKGIRAPTIRRSKLLIVDLAGSERVDKSGPFPLLFSFPCFFSSASFVVFLLGLSDLLVMYVERVLVPYCIYKGFWVLSIVGQLTIAARIVIDSSRE
jgi:hypothetical protein